MKRSLIVALTLFALLCSSQAMAIDDARPYFSIGGGLSKMKGASISDLNDSSITRISTDPGYNGLIAGGYAWDVGRLEFSGGVIYQKIDQLNFNANWADVEGEITVYHLLMSVFYDFNKNGMVSPYFGGGIGAARLDLTSDSLSGNDAVTFAYQLGAGFTLNTSDDFVIDFGYRLLGTNNLDFGETKANFFVFQNVNVGLRWLY